jgi:hypothetical protein
MGKATGREAPWSRQEEHQVHRGSQRCNISIVPGGQEVQVPGLHGVHRKSRSRLLQQAPGAGPSGQAESTGHLWFVPVLSQARSRDGMLRLGHPLETGMLSS